MVLLVNPLSVRGVLGPALSARPEGIVPRDGTRGRTRDPVLPLPVDDSVPSPPHLHANATPLLVARDVIAVARPPAEGDTHQMAVPGHVAEVSAKGQLGVAGALPLHGAERRAFLDLLPLEVGGAREAPQIVAATLAVNLQLMGVAWTPIAVA